MSSASSRKGGGRGAPNSSFYAFQSSTDDAWDAADDEYMSGVSVKMAHSTAQEVIDKHRQNSSTTAPTTAGGGGGHPHLRNFPASKNGQTRSSRSPMRGLGDVAAGGGRGGGRQGGGETAASPPVKPAPGMGIRLNSNPATDPPPQRQKIDRLRLEKFASLIKGPITSLQELRDLSWSGIPTEVRPTVWKLLCDYLPPSIDRREAVLAEKRTQYFNFVDQYFHMRQGQKVNSEMFHQIQKDLMRMNTLHNKPEMQELFERILFIWSMRHPASGYVQGINDLLTPYFVVYISAYVNVDLNTAGELILSSAPTAEELRLVEADCFWCVSRLLDSIQDHYTFAQPGIQTNVAALAKLIERLDGSLDNHIVSNKVEYLQFAFRWMNNLLMRELPLRCIIRLWDTYQSEQDGFSHFHLYVCAGFLLNFAAELKRERDFQGIILMLQNLPTYHWTDEEINMLLAEAYKLKCLFSQAPKHLDRVK